MTYLVIIRSDADKCLVISRWQWGGRLPSALSSGREGWEAGPAAPGEAGLTTATA